MKMNQLALLAVSMMASNLVFAASFDCRNASTRVEKLICSSETISKADSELGNVYTYVLANTYAKEKKSALIAEQKSWIMTIRDRCNDVNCLLHAYRTRIDDLSRIQTDRSTARYVVNQNERATQTVEFQRSLKELGINGKLTACDLMVELIEDKGGRDQSYGAVCKLNNRTVMICDDTMIGKLTLKLSGFAITGDDLADFTKENCPRGG